MHSTHPMHLDESLDPALSFHSVEGSRKFPGQKVPNRLAAGMTAVGSSDCIYDILCCFYCIYYILCCFSGSDASESLKGPLAR